MISFTKRFDDNSTDEGFKFTFYCDVSNEPLQSTFIESKSDKKSDGLRNAGKGIGIGGGFFGSKFGKQLSGSVGLRGLDDMIKKSGELVGDASHEYDEHSSGYLKEKEDAFQAAQEEVKKNFAYCSACNRWTCNHCWNVSKGKCIQDANSLSCPNGHENPEGTRFCRQCGCSFVPTCSDGHENPPGTKFCGVCGKSL